MAYIDNDLRSRFRKLAGISNNTSQPTTTDRQIISENIDRELRSLASGGYRYRYGHRSMLTEQNTSQIKAQLAEAAYLESLDRIWETMMSDQHWPRNKKPTFGTGGYSDVDKYSLEDMLYNFFRDTPGGTTRKKNAHSAFHEPHQNGRKYMSDYGYEKVQESSRDWKESPHAKALAYHMNNGNKEAFLKLLLEEFPRVNDIILKQDQNKDIDFSMLSFNDLLQDWPSTNLEPVNGVVPAFDPNVHFTGTAPTDNTDNADNADNVDDDDGVSVIDDFDDEEIVNTNTNTNTDVDNTNVDNTNVDNTIEVPAVNNTGSPTTGNYHENAFMKDGEFHMSQEMGDFFRLFANQHYKDIADEFDLSSPMNSKHTKFTALGKYSPTDPNYVQKVFNAVISDGSENDGLTVGQAFEKYITGGLIEDYNSGKLNAYFEASPEFKALVDGTITDYQITTNSLIPNTPIQTEIQPVVTDDGSGEGEDANATVVNNIDQELDNVDDGSGEGEDANTNTDVVVDPNDPNATTNVVVDPNATTNVVVDPNATTVTNIDNELSNVDANQNDGGSNTTPYSYQNDPKNNRKWRQTPIYLDSKTHMVISKADYDKQKIENPDFEGSYYELDADSHKYDMKNGVQYFDKDNNMLHYNPENQKYYTTDTFETEYDIKDATERKGYNQYTPGGQAYLEANTTFKPGSKEYDKAMKNYNKNQTKYYIKSQKKQYNQEKENLKQHNKQLKQDLAGKSDDYQTKNLKKLVGKNIGGGTYIDNAGNAVSSTSYGY